MPRAVGQTDRSGVQVMEREKPRAGSQGQVTQGPLREGLGWVGGAERGMMRLGGLHVRNSPLVEGMWRKM